MTEVEKLTPEQIRAKAEQLKLEREAREAADAVKSAEVVEGLAARKARIAQMLTRGTMNDRLADIDCPPDRRPVWVRETREDIAYYKGLGYRVETEFGRNFVDHDRGDNVARTGDCILMSIKREDYELIEEVEAELKKQRRDAPRKEYLAKAARYPQVPIIDEGN